MEKINEYRKSVDELLTSYNNSIVKENETLSDLIDNLKKNKNIITEMDNNLANLGNQFVKINKLSIAQIENINEINRSTLIEFIEDLNIPGLKAK